MSIFDDLRRMVRIVKTASECPTVSYILLDHHVEPGTFQAEVDDQGKRFVRMSPSVLDEVTWERSGDLNLDGLLQTDFGGIPIRRAESGTS
jgi:hypothetical protein